jgi:iron complex outermembrane recepter protein
MAMFPGRDSHATLPNIFSGAIRPGALLCLPRILVAVVVVLIPAMVLADTIKPVSEDMAAGYFVAVGDTLVVRAGAMTDPVSPSVAGVVTRVDLEEETGAKDLVSHLAAAAGLQVRRYGGLGFAGVPSLRGSAAAQIRIFLDGMPLDDSQSGAIDLSHLPLERFKAAEIHRGVVPVSLGGIGGAGAINLITRDRFAGTDVRLFAGSFGDRGGRITWGADSHDGSQSLLLMAHGRKADNDYAFTDHQQTFHDSSDDTTSIRANSGFEEFGFWGTGRLQSGKWDMRLSGGHFRKDGGRPGALNYPSPHASVRHGRTAGHLVVDFAGGLIHGDVSGGRTEQVLYDPENEIDDGFSGTIKSLGDDVTTRLAFAPVVFGKADLLMGLEHRYQTYLQWYGSREDPARNRKSVTAFTGLDTGFLEERARLALALRWQYNEDDFPPIPGLPWLPEQKGIKNTSENLSPSAGLMWKIIPDRITLESHASRTVRVPTWVELFGHRGGIDGNRSLRPEEITAADFGLTWEGHDGDLSCRLVGFLATTDDAIVFVQNSPTTSHALNLGRTETNGMEFEGRALLPAATTLLGNFTWQHARDKGDDARYHGNALPYLSDMEVQFRLSSALFSWQPWVEAAWQSSFYRDRDNTKLGLAPEQFEMNLGLKYQMHPDWLGAAGLLEFSAEAINITNNTVYDMEEYPLPGRRFHFSVRIQQ